jgi:uncharacterized protein YqeY
MNLKEKIQNDRMLALKEGNKEKRNILGVLIGELELKNKESTDEQVVSTVKKLIESNIISKTETENIYLECYLPTMLTEEELEKHIGYFCAQISGTPKKTMGEAMRYLKQEFPGLYDGKKASDIIKKYI